MDNKKNKKFSTWWGKYNDYEYKTLEDETYIVPVKNAKQEIYDPFDYVDKILVELLTIGRLVGVKETEIANKKILEFVKKYGLLGLMTYFPLNSNILQQDNVFLNKTNDIVKKEVISTEEYVKEFLKCDDEQEIQLQKLDKHGYAIITSKINVFSFSDKFEDRVLFSSGYSEKLSWIIHYAQQLYNLFFSIEQYCLEKTVEEKKIATIFSDNLKPYNISCQIVIEEKPQLQWNFNSLRLALDTMFSFEMTAEKKKLKMCKHCWKPFYSENVKAEYCSPKCRNQANVYKSRAKNTK